MNVKEGELLLSFAMTGNPLPKQSFRVREGGKGGYRDPRITRWQNEVSWRAKIAMQGREPFSGPLEVWIEFYRGNDARVDLDNLSKAALDSCNNIVWDDDQQVISLHLYKRVDRDCPGIVVDVYRVIQEEEP